MGQTAPFETSQQILSGEESFRRGANLVLYALFFFFSPPSRFRVLGLRWSICGVILKNLGVVLMNVYARMWS